MQYQSKPKTICQSQLLKRDWSHKAIARLLPRSEEAYNPYGFRLSKMLLWQEQDVLDAEQSEEFQKLKVNRRKRRTEII
jgi:hypothetical protein